MSGAELPLKLVQFLRLNAPTCAPIVRRLLLVIYAAALVIVLAAFFLGRDLPLHGNIHDIFIWVNAGLFIDMRLRPHVDFSSPLGPLYLYANYAAWRLVDNVGDMPLVVGLAFAAAFSALVWAYRGYVRTWLLPEAIVLVMLLALSGRQMGALGINLSWYGAYNRICWIGVVVLILVVLGKNAALLSPSKTDRLRVAMLAGGLLGLTFFVKINFFIAIGAIYGGWLIGSGAFRDLRTWAVPALLCGLAGGIALLLGVDIAGYLRDIAQAGSARDSAAASSIFHPVAFILAIVFLVANLIIDTLIGNTRDLGGRAVLYAGISAGIFLGIAGDFAKPLELFLIVLCYRAVDSFPQLVARADQELFSVVPLIAVPIVGALIFIVIEFYSVVLTSAYRLGGYSDAKSQAVSWSAPAPSNRTLRLRMGHEPEDGDYTLFARIMANTGERNAILKAIGDLRQELFELSNKGYVAQIDEGREVLQRLGNLSDQTVFPLEFSNPYPFLLGTRPPRGALLWYHDGTTLNGSVPTSLDVIFDRSDVVLVPHISVDAQMRPVLNGMFERYNRRTSKFCEFHVGFYWSFYRRCAQQG
jgi:hypothetical protein